MGIKVLVNSAPKNRVSINNQSRDTIRTVGVGVSSGATMLSELTDVQLIDLQNDDTLVYDDASGKFVNKKLPVLNGGTF
jgi:hypothetical protein